MEFAATSKETQEKKGPTPCNLKGLLWGLALQNQGGLISSQFLFYWYPLNSDDSPRSSRFPRPSVSIHEWRGCSTMAGQRAKKPSWGLDWAFRSKLEPLLNSRPERSMSTR